MTKTSKAETVLELGDADNALVVSADHEPGQVPTEVFVHGAGSGRFFSIETVLRVAEAVKRAGWVPEGHYVCADHGLYDARSSDSARCSRCEVTR